MLLDTLKELFEANEPLFQGLAIHDAWDWSVRHPVVRLSFAAGSFGEPEQLPADFADQLTELESATASRRPTQPPTAASRAYSEHFTSAPGGG